MSGGASVGVSNSNETRASAYYMGDSINFTLSGETDSGLTITQKIELENGVDNQSTAIAGDFGTLTYHAHGGDSVMSGWDDMTPTAYEESWALATVTVATGTSANTEVVMIDGRSKSTRLNSSHITISYAVFCLKKKTSNYVFCYSNII